MLDLGLNKKLKCFGDLISRMKVEIVSHMVT